MFAFLKSRTFFLVLGLLLLALVIWLFGPAVKFANPFDSDAADLVPMGDTLGKLIAIGLVVAIWLISVLVKRLKANRASDQLVAAVVQQSAGKEQPSAEALQLRERFEEAVAALKEKRRSGHSLYDLPWYVIIGAPGSGKTTALVNSGLNFPLEQRTGKGALRGVGGTRNCDWWFTDEAVLLDTAGRYTTQDSDAASDSAGWAEFLALLRKYRKRRPLNGVILTISAQDLMTQGQGGPEGHVLAARRRLNELNKELRIQLPVYLMVTKCDLVAGFSEYFDDLTQEGRAQVWGVTFPYEKTLKGGAAEALPAEFDALVERLNERLFARLEEERDVRRRTKIFAFPQQMAALKDALTSFVSEVFGGTRFDQRILLRGAYFTSGTQVGNPIDRLLGAIGRRFSVASDVAPPASGKGRAYFIQKLLKDVLFAESGLAGVDRRTEALRAAGQLGAYAGIALVVVLAVIAWSYSYRQNQNYLNGVDAAVAKLSGLPPNDGALTTVVSRLDALGAVVDVARLKDSPYGMHWGLYQGGAIGDAAEDAYRRELKNVLLPIVAAAFQQHLTNYSGRPEELYEYLKVYLMLGNPKYLDKDDVAAFADIELAAYPESRASLSKHFRFLLDRLPPSAIDEDLANRARRTVLQASLPTLIYLYIRDDYRGDASHDVRLDQITGLDKVLRRKSGSMATPVPGIYTKPVFDDVVKSLDKRVADFRNENWVWGKTPDTKPPVTSPSKVRTAVLDRYETEYIAYWKSFLGDLDSVLPGDLQRTKESLRLLAAPTSPLKALLKTVDDNTYFPKPSEAAQSAVDAAIERARKLSQMAASDSPTTYPGAQITQAFKAIHDLMSGQPPLIDTILAKVEDVRQKVDPIGTGVGSVEPGNPQAIKSVGDSVRSLQADAGRLPSGMAQALSQLADGALNAVRSDTGRFLEAQYQDEVLTRCGQLAANRFPFDASAREDIAPKDFASLFGPNGVYDNFYRNRLASLTMRDRNGALIWREASGAPVSNSSTMLQKVNQAEKIREMFFRNGPDPELRFTLTDISQFDREKVTLQVENQSVTSRHGPFTPVDWTWKGQPSPAFVTWEDQKGPPTKVETDGAWAWLRLVRSQQIAAKTDTTYELTISKDGYSMKVVFDARTKINPYGSTVWQNFSCQ